MQSFYLADEQHKTLKGDVVEFKGVLFFKQDRSGFDGKATKDHVKGYPKEFQLFKDAHPEFVLPDSFLDLEVGQPVSAPAAVAPVAEAAPVVEAPKDEDKPSE